MEQWPPSHCPGLCYTSVSIETPIICHVNTPILGKSVFIWMAWSRCRGEPSCWVGGASSTRCLPSPGLTGQSGGTWLRLSVNIPSFHIPLWLCNYTAARAKRRWHRQMFVKLGGRNSIKRQDTTLALKTIREAKQSVSFSCTQIWNMNLICRCTARVNSSAKLCQSSPVILNEP